MSAHIITNNISFDNNVTTNTVDGGLWIGSASGNPAPATLSVSNGITLTNGPNSIALSFNQSNAADPYTTVNFAASPYTVLATDYFISVDSSGGAVSIVFPNTLTNNRSWVVKDRTGNANAFNITLSTTGGNTIDGAATLVMNVNFSSVQVFLASTNLEVF